MFFLLNIYISSLIRCVCALMPIEARRERVLETLEFELQAVGLGAENILWKSRTNPSDHVLSQPSFQLHCMELFTVPRISLFTSFYIK